MRCDKRDKKTMREDKAGGAKTQTGGRERGGGQRKSRDHPPRARTAQWEVFQEAQWSDILVPQVEPGTCSPGACLDLAQAAAMITAIMLSPGRALEP